MSLFSITRYSEDATEEDASESNPQKAILQRLHRAAEERKRKSLSSEKPPDADRSTHPPNKKPEATDVPKTKKRKKEDTDEDTAEELGDVGQTTPVKSQTSVKKQKETRKKDLPDGEGKRSKKKIKHSSSPVKDQKDKLQQQTHVPKEASDDHDDGENSDDTEDSSDQLEHTLDHDRDTRTDSDSDQASDQVEDDIDEDAAIDDDDISAAQTHQDIGGFTVIGDIREQKPEKVERMLPHWLSHPTVVTDDIRNKCTPLENISGLDPELVQKLRDNGIKDFFPVQSVLLPALLESTRHGFMYGKAGYRPCDICCSAPTGSGKTLAYVLPIVQCLCQRVVPQVRALVVLPVRDLATQVFKVFSTYCSGTKLKVGQIIGKKTFASEQQMLVGKGARGYHSNMDILVTTPGRLVDHINSTPGFTLKHLRFLVIDEADRMMDEIKQDWLSCVERAVYTDSQKDADKTDKILGDITRLAPGQLTCASMNKLTIPLQKLLFSATLSQNPEKLQSLNLFQPKLYTAVVGESHVGNSQELGSTVKKKGEFIGKYTTPTGLTEYFTASSPAEKPLLMIHFIQHFKFRHILCFTNSIEATHRLCLILKETCDLTVREFSSNLKTGHRNKILKQFADGKIDILVCSDAMARGIDIDNVQYVISYESAPYLKTYIHRVGRTARAGKVGTAISLLSKPEIFHFKKMLKEAGKTGIQELKIKVKDLEQYVPEYQTALKEVQHVLEGEHSKR